MSTPLRHFRYWVSDGGGSPRRSAPVLGRSNVGTRASPNGIGRIGTTGARCARGRAHSDSVVVRRHAPIAVGHWLHPLDGYRATSLPRWERSPALDGTAEGWNCGCFSHLLALGNLELFCSSAKGRACAPVPVVILQPCNLVTM